LALAACAPEQGAPDDAAQAKLRAQRLFIDYRDPVFTVLKTYLGDYRSPNRIYRIYVELFGEEVDASLKARLAHAGVVIEPGWGCDPQGPRSGAPNDVEILCIAIPSIESLGQSQYRMTLNHFEKASIDHIPVAVAVVQFEDGKWNIVQLRPL